MAATIRIIVFTVLIGAMPFVTAVRTTAATLRVGAAESHTTIATALAQAQPADTVRVSPGHYNESGLIIDKPIVVLGIGYPVIDSEGGGDILTVTAAGTVVRGLQFQNVGASFIEDRAALRVKSADSTRVEDCHFLNTIFGIYLEHSTGVSVIGNTLNGSGGREVTAGNGIHVWYCKLVHIEGNEIHGHRDGIYFEFVENSVIRSNLSSHNIRYGFYFMFLYYNEYADNRFVANGAGVAVMYTEHVSMHGNVFADNWGASSYGLLLKDIRDSEITDNRFIGNTVGLQAEGCDRLIVQNNDFLDNGFAARIMANSMGGTYSRNNFEGNAFDVATNSRQNFNTFDSNYWSTYRGYDLDRDGVGDVPHHPVRLFSLLVEKAPPAVALLGSLFVSIVDTAERVMPVFTPETLVDRTPRMTPATINNRFSDDLQIMGGKQ